MTPPCGTTLKPEDLPIPCLDCVASHNPDVAKRLPSLRMEVMAKVKAEKDKLGANAWTLPA